MPQPPQATVPIPKGARGICQERGQFQELLKLVSSPSSAVLRGLAPGSPGIPAAWLQPLVSGLNRC